jgi:hypothetical protein
VTLVVDAILVVGGIALGRWIMRRVRARGAAALPEGSPPAKAEAAPVAAQLPASLPCRLGDVVVRAAGGGEAWLAGALVLGEEHPVAALFAAPEAGGDLALYVRDVPGTGIVWLSPLPDGAIAATKEPPHTIEHDGVRFERARRVPMRASRIGSGAPWPGDQAILAEYTGQGADRILVLAGTEKLLAWKGVLLGEGEYDVLPGTDTTRVA